MFLVSKEAVSNPIDTKSSSEYEDQAKDLYIAKEASDELQQLVQKARAELGEADVAEHVFHQAVAEKNASRERLSTLVGTFRAGARRIYGTSSREYRTLRDSTFKGWSKKAAEVKATPA